MTKGQLSTPVLKAASMSKKTLTLLFILFFSTGISGIAATTKCQDSQASVKPQLKAARGKLRLSETTRDRVARNLENLKQSGQADPDMLQDYTIYLQRVQDLVDENRRIVLKIEALCAAETNQTATSGGEKGALQPAPTVSGENTVGEVALLDRRLRESLASFDEILLKRINAIQVESAEKMRDLAEQAAQAAGRAHQGGAGATASAKSRKGGQQGKETSQGEGESRGGETSRQGQHASQGGKTGRQGTSSGTGQSGSDQGATARQSGGKEPSGAGSSIDTGSSAARTYSRDDDDIVARQLREAAEQEKNPELKKKLWKEYEEYKKNTRP